MKLASKIGSIAFLSLLLISMSLTVYAETQVFVYIMNPLSGSSGAKGVLSGGYWVGEIPIKIGGDIDTVASSGEQAKAYCMNFDKTVYVGGKYPAHTAGVIENAEWRAVSYILTWYHPPADGDAAAANQAAIWKLLNVTRGYVYEKPVWLSSEIDNAGNVLADLAYGKDVVRQNDVFTWIEPITGNMSSLTADPGDTITFKAKLTTSEGVPRANVKIIFSARISPGDIALDPAYLTPTETHTNSEGIAEVAVTVPLDIQNGATIEVKASTRSVWPQLYLDLDDERRQDLIGIGTTYELTVTTNVCILAFIFVIPEVPLGTLTAGVACAFAFAFWKKGGRLKKLKTK